MLGSLSVLVAITVITCPMTVMAISTILSPNYYALPVACASVTTGTTHQITSASDEAALATLTECMAPNACALSITFTAPAGDVAASAVWASGAVGSKAINFGNVQAALSTITAAAYSATTSFITVSVVVGAAASTWYTGKAVYTPAPTRFLCSGGIVSDATKRGYFTVLAPNPFTYATSTNNLCNNAAKTYGSAMTAVNAAILTTADITELFALVDCNTARLCILAINPLSYAAFDTPLNPLIISSVTTNPPSGTAGLCYTTSLVTASAVAISSQATGTATCNTALFLCMLNRLVQQPIQTLTGSSIIRRYFVSSASAFGLSAPASYATATANTCSYNLYNGGTAIGLTALIQTFQAIIMDNLDIIEFSGTLGTTCTTTKPCALFINPVATAATVYWDTGSPLYATNFTSTAAGVSCYVAAVDSNNNFLISAVASTAVPNTCLGAKIVCMENPAVPVPVASLTNTKGFILGALPMQWPTATTTYATGMAQSACVSLSSTYWPRVFLYPAVLADTNDVTQAATLCTTTANCILAINPVSNLAWDTIAAGNSMNVSSTLITSKPAGSGCYSASITGTTTTLALQQAAVCNTATYPAASTVLKVLCMQYGKATTSTRRYFAGDIQYPALSTPFKSYPGNFSLKCNSANGGIVSTATDVTELWQLTNINGLQFCYNDLTGCLLVANPNTNGWDLAVLPSVVTSSTSFHSAIATAISGVSTVANIQCVYFFITGTTAAAATITVRAVDSTANPSLYNCMGKRVLCMTSSATFLSAGWLHQMVVCILLAMIMKKFL